MAIGIHVKRAIKEKAAKDKKAIKKAIIFRCLICQGRELGKNEIVIRNSSGNIVILCKLCDKKVGNLLGVEL